YFSIFYYSLSFDAALGIMSFGLSVNMFNYLNSQDIAESINFYYKNITSYTFNNWINNLLGFRNRLAHYKELYRLSSYDTLKTITTTYNDGNSYDDEFEHSTLFYYTIIIARLSPDVENIEDFIDNVGILFRKAERKNECFNLQKDYSFPKTWKLILENEKSTKVNVLQ
ncbi:MAG: Abi family protein, partial [Erysipelotrichaceae bacterium]|nr:Abi family protein [Erysipelotrichaceae bacterium]